MKTFLAAAALLIATFAAHAQRLGGTLAIAYGRESGEGMLIVEAAFQVYDCAILQSS